MFLDRLLGLAHGKVRVASFCVEQDGSRVEINCLVVILFSRLELTESETDLTPVIVGKSQSGVQTDGFVELYYRLFQRVSALKADPSLV